MDLSFLSRRQARTGAAAVAHLARRRHAPWIAGVVLALVIAATLVPLQLMRDMHAREKAAAVFPDHSGQYAASNRALGGKQGQRIVLFGDSRVVQWTGFPRVPGTEVVARGIAGETTAQMRMRFEADVVDLDPDIVVLQLGINDLVAIGVLPDRRREIAAQCADNLEYFVQTLGARGTRVVLLTVIPPADPPWWRRPFWSDAIAQEVEALNRRWLDRPAMPWLSVIDAGAALQDGAGQWTDGVLADALHLTARGYERLNAAVEPVLANHARTGGWHAVQ